MKVGRDGGGQARQRRCGTTRTAAMERWEVQDGCNGDVGRRQKICGTMEMAILGNYDGTGALKKIWSEIDMW